MIITDLAAAESEGGGSEVQIGHHWTVEIGGLTFNFDTMLSTVIAGSVVIVLGLMLRRSATNEVPGKLQLAWEALVSWVNEQVEGNLGRLNPFVVPLAVSLFVFILVANLVEIVPTDHKVPPATADVNLTYPLALLVFVTATAYGIRERGIRDFAKGLAQPHWIMTPINVIEEIAKPVSLSLRLFGNLFAGGVMLSIIGLLPFWITPLPTVIWKLFSIFIGLIQALIFALLTILYFGMAGSGHGGDDHESHDSDDEAEKEPEGELQPA
ncbi:MAG: F0F1 ATP synthase subunit A [Aeromicrobium sp.]